MQSPEKKKWGSFGEIASITTSMSMVDVVICGMFICSWLFTSMNEKFYIGLSRSKSWWWSERYSTLGPLDCKSNAHGAPLPPLITMIDHIRSYTKDSEKYFIWYSSVFKTRLEFQPTPQWLDMTWIICVSSYNGCVSFYSAWVITSSGILTTKDMNQCQDWTHCHRKCN